MTPPSLPYMIILAYSCRPSMSVIPTRALGRLRRLPLDKVIFPAKLQRPPWLIPVSLLVKAVMASGYSSFGLALALNGCCICQFRHYEVEK